MTIREWSLFNSGKIFVNTRTKSLDLFNINSELTCSDLFLDENFQHLDQ